MYIHIQGLITKFFNQLPTSLIGEVIYNRLVEGKKDLDKVELCVTILDELPS
jgi:hypothetical protein